MYTASTGPHGAHHGMKTRVVRGVECVVVADKYSPTTKAMSALAEDLGGFSPNPCGLCPAGPQWSPVCSRTNCKGVVFCPTKYWPIIQMRSNHGDD